ncbi:MAG: hypothetical protein J4G04_07545 [Nitrosopumilaceae archaeon]|nr:hypothetical protein [Nitrosopumilaceae archaeon]
MMFGTIPSPNNRAKFSSQSYPASQLCVERPSFNPCRTVVSMGASIFVSCVELEVTLASSSTWRPSMAVA